MPTHPDAIGYLRDLAKQINKPWFNMVCDLAAASGTSTLDDLALETLLALYTERASYIGIKPAAAMATAVSPAVPSDSLEQLHSFTNFKLLGDSLDVTFKKRLTLIFGANGSGKSSLCESLKVLATPEPPNRPLQNVRAVGAATPAFCYKFNSDAAQQVWTPVVGYGSRRTTVKYFDTAIAISNVKDAVEPGRVIVLTPFRLHVFELTKTLTTTFREALQRMQLENSAKLTQALDAIRADFTKFEGRPLSVIDDNSVAVLAAEVTLGGDFTSESVLTDKRGTAAELEKAASEQGLKLLKAEHREMEDFLSSLSTLLTSAKELWVLEPASKATTLIEKQAAQELLAQALIPKDGTLDGWLALIHAAAPLCKMDEAAGHACPLCKRGLGAPEIQLFRRYHDLLAGELEKDISALKSELVKANEIASAVASVDRKVWDKYATIPADLLTAAKVGSGQVVLSCELSKEPTAEAKAALETLNASTVTWTARCESKKNAIETAAKGREELVEQLERLRAEIEPLEYAQAINERLVTLREAQQMVDDAALWSSRLPIFTQLLKSITNSAKEAYEQLVVGDFEARLDAEYKALTEKNMASFGVRLVRKGTDAAVTVLPQIGSKAIDGVLSEGEQRVHALALFFAEMETCSHSVLVFDDPISSFDYNYIDNYCGRLRDFAVTHPTLQIIVLTHNWEFFVNLQAKLNGATLNGQLSVQVLENCAVVADYSESADELRASIAAILVAPGEPIKAIKEEMAAKLRRLIESVVNTHVFNKQRHQYKQKSQPVSTFQEFTKLVPLLPAEAARLGDLYSKLSISEHDDPRNAYVNTDKATFQSRYDAVTVIETALIARK